MRTEEKVHEVLDSKRTREIKSKTSYTLFDQREIRSKTSYTLFDQREIRYTKFWKGPKLRIPYLNRGNLNQAMI